MQDAKAMRAECKVQCDEDFMVARDLCRNVDPECAQGCRAAQSECRAAILAALDTCVDGCRVQLNLDREACPKRGRGRDVCLNRAQVRAFVCRDDCRDDLAVKPGLGACRDDFRACMAGCVLSEPEPSPEPTPVVPR